MQGFQLTFFTEQGRRHAHGPVHVGLMALARAQCTALFERFEAEQANLFYVKTPVEFGVVGATGVQCGR